MFVIRYLYLEGFVRVFAGLHDPERVGVQFGGSGALIRRYDGDVPVLDFAVLAHRVDTARVPHVRIAHGQIARIENGALAEEIAVAIRIVGHPVVFEHSVVEIVPGGQPIRRNLGSALVVDEAVSAKERGHRAWIGPELEVETELDNVVW